MWKSFLPSPPPLDAVVDFLALIGRVTLAFLQKAGRIAAFAALALRHCVFPPYHWRAMVGQMIEIGYYSLPVVGLTTLFSGMVLALQSYTGFARFSAEGAVATVVVISMVRELGPVLAALMVAGRVGASMAAELGAMRVTEQIDALTTLSTNPFKYLIAPRLLAGLLTLPMLVVVGDVIGVFGGYLIGVYTLGFNPGNYIQRTWEYLEAMDVVSGLAKAAAFGFIIALIGCYHGYSSRGGAQGVGRATRDAVVVASILILVSNYLISVLFFTQ